jgi:DNA invertase Pin-like site-specific DNA recombinase
VGYVRVSTEEQGDSGAGLEAQRLQITAEVARRGWNLVRIYQDVISGKSINGRQGLKDALAAIESGEADGLVVAKLDRLSRSMLDFATLMERSRQNGWALIALDLGVDTTTPAGELVASVMASFAQHERRIIGQRTRDALAVKKSQGVKLGKPTRTTEATVRRIRRHHKSGKTLAAIAALLNRDHVPTGHGGREWWPSTVKFVLDSARAKEGA